MLCFIVFLTHETKLSSHYSHFICFETIRFNSFASKLFDSAFINQILKYLKCCTHLSCHQYGIYWRSFLCNSWSTTLHVLLGESFVIVLYISQASDSLAWGTACSAAIFWNSSILCHLISSFHSDITILIVVNGPVLLLSISTVGFHTTVLSPNLSSIS